MGDLATLYFVAALLFCSLLSFKPPSLLSTSGRRVLLLLLLRRADRPSLDEYGIGKGRSVQRNSLDSWIDPRDCVELSFSASPTTGRFGTGSAREACTCRDLQQTEGLLHQLCQARLFKTTLQRGSRWRHHSSPSRRRRTRAAAFGVKDRVTPAMADWHWPTELAH